jgi:uncharacterized protein with PQ loop repeat
MIGFLLLAIAVFVLILICLKLEYVGIFRKSDSPIVYWSGIGLLGLGLVICVAIVLIKVT